MNTEEVKQVIVVRKDLNMRKGKIGAQCAHAAMAFILDQATHVGRDDQTVLDIEFTEIQDNWLASGTTKIVVSVDTEEELLKLFQAAKNQRITAHKVIDAGRTEFNGVPTLTCVAFGPEKSKVLDELTGHLKLI